MTTWLAVCVSMFVLVTAQRPQFDKVSSARTATATAAAAAAVDVANWHNRTAKQADDIGRIFYLHIMKTGGSTLNELLRFSCKNREIAYSSTESPVARWSRTRQRSSLRIVSFREPIARVISHYWQVKPWGEHSGGSNLVCRDHAAESYDAYLRGCSFSHNYQSRYFTRGYLTPVLRKAAGV